MCQAFFVEVQSPAGSELGKGTGRGKGTTDKRELVRLLKVYLRVVFLGYKIKNVLNKGVKTTLYLGTNPTNFTGDGHLIHYPVIKIIPRDPHLPELQRAYGELEKYTHLIFTSKNAVDIFFAHLKQLGKRLAGKTVVAIGEVTEKQLAFHGIRADLTAEEETQEGVIELLEKQPLDNAYIFLPCSSIARDILTQFLQQKNIRFLACDLYDTLPQKLEPVPDLAHVDEIVFTSPSTVSAFLQIYGRLPEGKTLLALGPITEKMMRKIARGL